MTRNLKSTHAGERQDVPVAMRYAFPAMAGTAMTGKGNSMLDSFVPMAVRLLTRSVVLLLAFWLWQFGQNAYAYAKTFLL
jgi:hypothetical protein